ncbi:hypothetical protein FACS1894132_09570 [Clostridia bacterium]|nr:hypothetical protein FACS1894132_09570 [Clostridia bacterium]
MSFCVMTTDMFREGEEIYRKAAIEKRKKRKAEWNLAYNQVLERRARRAERKATKKAKKAVYQLITFEHEDTIIPLHEDTSILLQEEISTPIQEEISTPMQEETLKQAVAVERPVYLRDLSEKQQEEYKKSLDRLSKVLAEKF